MTMRRLLAVLAVGIVCAAAPAAAQAIPVVDVECNGSSTCDGVWFTSPVVVKWTVAGAVETDGCQDVTIDIDTTGTPQGCIAKGSGVTSVTVTIRLDQRPPTLTGIVPERPPDHAGWYTHPVAFSVQAADETAGLAGCDAPSYAGPDTPKATILATCRDRAGNVGSRVLPLSYDATPPDARRATLFAGDRVVRLSWPTGVTARLARTPGTGRAISTIYKGRGNGFTDRRVRNGRRYRYTITLTDAAGNVASRDLSATPGPHLIGPARGATVAQAPVLRWTHVRGARYYNVQLFRKGKKVFSAWPARPRMRLHRTWRFHGKRYRLRPGRYQWYVWPGRGARALQRYGPLVGRRHFRVVPAGQTAAAAPRRSSRQLG